jgi:hypothetical protein
MNLIAPVLANGAPADISFRVKFVHSPFVQKKGAPQGTPGEGRTTTCYIAVASPAPINSFSEEGPTKEGQEKVFLTPIAEATSICKGADVNSWSAAYGRKNSLEKALRVLIDREKYTTSHAFVKQGLAGCPFVFTDNTVKAFIKALHDKYPRAWDLACSQSKLTPTVYSK